ncbi:hypothetical protein TSO5_30275 [Azospirillum sp. TSO5]|nr:hypothetical protein TSO5_30275 [Azospirillum sp. TSO5]
MKQAAAAAVTVCLLALPAGAQTLRDSVEGAWRLNPEIRSLEAKEKANLGESHDSVKVVNALTMPGQKPVQARFEVGHPGH